MGRRPFRPLRHAFEAAALSGLALVARLLPFRAGSALGALLGAGAGRLLARRRAIAVANLSSALGLSAPEASRLADRVFRQLGRSFVEFLGLPARSARELERRFAFDDGFARVEEHARRGNGSVLVTAHYGNWEYLGAMVGRRLGGVAYVFPAQSNRGADGILNGTRARLGVELIPMEEGMRRALKRLLRGGAIGLLADQDARKIGVHLPFLGRPASTLTGPARLAIRARCPIYVAVLERSGPGRFRARSLAWLEPSPEAEEEGEVRRLSGAINAALEEAIRRRPDHWYWIHRRWKTPPPAEGSTM
jgi:KDO2-lipid IV(A) lauroyltransferase